MGLSIINPSVWLASQNFLAQMIENKFYKVIIIKYPCIVIWFIWTLENPIFLEGQDI